MGPMGRSVETSGRVLGLAVAALAAVGLTACSSSGHSGGAPSSGASTPAGSGASTVPAPALASASAGSLVITGGYVPQPASPDVAAAYLTITNDGGTAEKLVTVTTSVTGTVMPMTETDTGSVGSMTDLSSITVPAHGSVQFVPNHAHLMLEKPKQLRVGDQVSMTLTFSPATTVRITLPVVPIGSVPAGPTALPTSGRSSGMPAMPGMTMSGS